VCRQSSGYRVDPMIEFSPRHTATHWLRLNQCHALRLRFGLQSHKISKIGLRRPGVDRLNRRFPLVHGPEFGTIRSAPDTMVMT
jgi:hypothetical protein